MLFAQIYTWSFCFMLQCKHPLFSPAPLSCVCRFQKLSARWFREFPWPEAERVREFVEDDDLFLHLYRELYYRHIYAMHKVSARGLDTLKACLLGLHSAMYSMGRVIASRLPCSCASVSIYSRDSGSYDSLCLLDCCVQWRTYPK